MKPHENVIENELMFKGWFANRTKNYDKAKDLYQDFAFKVLIKEKGKKFINKYAQTKWLWLVAQSVFIDWARGESRRRKTLLYVDKYVEHKYHYQESFEEKLHLEEQKKAVEVALKKLPEDQERVYRMRAIAKIPFKTIADIYGISINTAIGQMRYARIGLKKRLLLAV